MPTYEYQCKSCSHRFEVWQKMADEPLRACPACQGTIRRVFFPAGIVFKGSGFYKTDHGNGAVMSENNHQGDTGESKETKESAAKKESSSETKTGTTSEKPVASSDKAAAAAD